MQAKALRCQGLHAMKSHLYKTQKDHVYGHTNLTKNASGNVKVGD